VSGSVHRTLMILDFGIEQSEIKSIRPN
jgi:hypothetical protein